jgi:hypothetical protein
MTALAKHETRSEVGHASSDTANLLAVIERMVRDPQVDVVKVEKLFDLQERIIARNAEAAYNEALASMQPELPEVEQRGQNTHTKTHYAKWEDIHEAIAPILSKYGFALTFRTAEANSKVTVTAILRHKAGHKDETALSLPTDTGAGRNAVQAVGSSLSYGKRYTACAILNIRTRGEDDDGKAATKRSGTKVAGAVTANDISRQVRDDVQNGDEPGLEIADPRKDPLWNELKEALEGAQFTTKDEAKGWLWQQKQKGKRYAGKHHTWRKAFYEEVYLPVEDDLPEAPR